jgi:hypothetical protein
MRVSSLVILVILGAAASAWTERQTLMKYWHAHMDEPQQASVTSVYTWKDSDGTVHFSSHADDKKAKEMVVDTRHITRLDPIAPKEDKDNKDNKEQKAQLLLNKVREEMEQKRQQMQEAKEKKIMGE